MSNSFTEDVKDLLVGAGVGTYGGTSSWGIFIGTEPDSPANCITLYDTVGESPNPKYSLDAPRLQVRVRSLDYIPGFAKAEEAFRALLGIPSQEVNGTWYVGIWCVLPTHFLMRDDLERKIFVSTWRSIREPSDLGHREEL